MKKEDLNILTLIPARGGSKRLPGKNIKDLCGKPLIAWTIEAALNSKYLNDVIVSTDCEEIAGISKKFGARVPFIRPESISQDQTEIPEVIDHTLENINGDFTHLLLLQPTCPLRTTEDIDSSIEMLLEKQANAVYSVCEVDHSPLWSNTLPENSSFDNFLRPEIAGVRSQDLPTYYRLNGAVYLVHLACFLEKESLFQHKNSFAYVMDKKASIDIDDELDFTIAETLIENKSSK